MNEIKPPPRSRGVYLLPNLFPTAGLLAGSFAVIAAGDVKLREGGCLADIAPTMLPYIGLPVPEEMTGKSIIAE